MRADGELPILAGVNPERVTRCGWLAETPAARHTRKAKERMRCKVILLLTLAVVSGAFLPSRTEAQSIQPAAYRSGAPAPAVSLVIESFLRAVNANDLESLGNLFGTTKGPISKRDPKPNVEQRMFALASVLRHEDYRIENTEIVPGRSQEATRVNVRMVIGGRTHLVPWTLVRADRESWLVEQIGIETITSAR